MDGWMNRWMDGWMGGWMGGCWMDVSRAPEDVLVGGGGCFEDLLLQQKVSMDPPKTPRLPKEGGKGDKLNDISIFCLMPL